jgi:NAD(P)-dependent dehydrogenase (short-subunit alcohol dehydrogenase family)
MEHEVEGLVEKACSILGSPLTVLINNASIFEMERLPDSTRESWDRHIESNLRAPVHLTQQFATQVPKTDSANNQEAIATACVINMLDQRVWRPTPFFMSYTIAKMGLWAFTQTAALELAPRIRVNAIGPGPTLPSTRQSQEHFQNQRQSTPLKRGTNVEDICQAMNYLIHAPSVTGQMIAVDGGQHLDWRIASVVNANE